MFVVVLLAVGALVWWFALRGKPAAPSLPRSPVADPSPTPIKQFPFQPFHVEGLGDDALDTALKSVRPGRGFWVYKGQLSSGDSFAVLIGVSNEWVNVYLLNRKKQQEYEEYGFHLEEKRWSYGSKPLGGGEIREFLAEARPQILQLMEGLNHERERVEQERADRRAENAREQQQVAEDLARVREIDEERIPFLREHFGPLPFTFNRNSRNRAAAEKDCQESGQTVDFDAQTCTCKQFTKYLSNYELGDLRRLCHHMVDAAYSRSMIAKSPDQLTDHILKQQYRDISGVRRFSFGDGKEAAILVLRGYERVRVYTPKQRTEGYTESSWIKGEQGWTSPQAAKQTGPIVIKELESCLP